MLGYYGNKAVIDNDVLYAVEEYGFFMILGIVFSTPIMKIVFEKLEETKARKVFFVLEPLLYGMILVWATSFLILGAHNPFIYFNF